MAAWVVVGAGLVLLPIGWRLNRFVVWLFYFNKSVLGIDHLSIDGYAFLLNMLLFAIPTVLLAVVWPRLRVWVWAGLALLLSVSVEVAQWRWLPRDATWLDVLANTVGAVLAAIVIDLWRRTTRRS